ncbi:MAG: polysaccharide biosynthesis/export family protein [Candidatus Omnitrophota bacterium]|jgi:polysaccharide export outer membrane protein
MRSAKLFFAAFLFSVLTFSAAYAADKEYGYTVGVGDILELNILQPEKMLLNVAVAPDGAISVPYIGSLPVKGLTLTAAQDTIQARLSEGYMKYPVVVLSLVESRSRKVLVYGEVIRPGEYPLDEDSTVLRAISMAGGFTKYGSSSRVKVLRPKKDGPGYDTVKISIADLMEGKPEADILVKPGDIVVVSEGVF